MENLAKLYIAETDENGEVRCVWVSDKTSRAPRPVKHPLRHLNACADADFAGAGRDQITDWLVENYSR